MNIDLNYQNFSLIIFFLIFTILIFKKNIFFSNKINILDKPDEYLKKHKKTVPLTGGIYCFIFFNIINSIFFILQDYYISTNIIIVFISSFIFFIGLYDDKNNISPNLKLLFCTIIILIGLSFDDSLIIKQLFFHSISKTIYLNYLALPITTLCILLLINALNMSDGINSLSVGNVIIWIFGILIHDFINDKFIFIILLLFLIFIFLMIYKSKFFLGDNGTMFLATFIGLIIIFAHNISINSNPIPADLIFIILMFPGFDMLRLFIIRILNKKNPFKGDLNHLHHHLMRKFNLNYSLFIYLSFSLTPIIISKIYENYLIIIIFSVLSYLILLSYLFSKVSKPPNSFETKDL